MIDDYYPHIISTSTMEYQVKETTPITNNFMKIGFTIPNSKFSPMYLFNPHSSYLTKSSS